MPRRERRERVESALAHVGLETVAGRLASTYSGGMVRRLELAQALVTRPRCWSAHAAAGAGRRQAFAAGVRAVSQVVVVLVLASILGGRFQWRPLGLAGAVAAVMLESSFFASLLTTITPAWVRAITHVNPLSYEVNALRQLLLGLPGNLAADFGALLVATVVGIAAASPLLGRLAR